MAKNRSMAIKHSKAKKWAMKEILENAKIEMCCKTIPNNVYTSDYSYDNFFYSKYAIQKRIDALVGTHYPMQEFIKGWSNVYEYLITHTVPEAREHYSQKEISLMQLELQKKGELIQNKNGGY